VTVDPLCLGVSRRLPSYLRKVENVLIHAATKVMMDSGMAIPVILNRQYNNLDDRTSGLMDCVGVGWGGATL